MLSLIMTALLLPMTSFAQQTSDSFFCVDDAFNGNRDVFAFNGLHNQTFGDAPLGSGLLVLGALGAGYAIARRKRNKKGAALLLALALTLGFTQCKKKVEQVVPVNANKVNITLNVDGRHIVTPGAENATVTYEDGDKIYVGDGTHYIGTLTRTSGAFSGEIVEPVDGTKIDFFFVGGLEPSVTPTASTTTDFTVNISNQSSNLPVLSCGSAEYNHGTTEYNCELKNKCALVELTLTSGTTDAVGIGDRYTQATINFGGTPGIVPNTSITGMITMKPSSDSEDNTKKYAILLPQDAVDGSAIAIGHVGYTLDIPAMENNDYTKLSNSGAVASNIVYLNYLTTDYTATTGQTLTGTLALNKKISIADGATVTLNNVTIIGTNDSHYEWAGITCEGDATIILSGTNTVMGFYEDYPGIYVPENKTVTIQGSGSLTASSNGYGAGIGGGFGISCGNIEIQDGVITATGGWSGAGIGAGCGVSIGESICGTITISGGTVIAIGGSYAAGIGSGYAQNADNPSTCGAISISGGTVSATAGALAPAAIGKGAVDAGESTCASVTITPDITSLTLTNTNSGVTGIVSDFINATAVNANTTPITTMLSTSVTDPAITGGMTSAGFATSYDGGTKTWTITRSAAPAATSLSELKTAINGGTDCSSYIGWEVNSAGAIAESGVSGTKIGYVAYVSTSDVDAGVSGSRILVIASADAAANTTWGSQGTARGVEAVEGANDLKGYSNTNTLQGFGSAAHPAAYAAWNYSATIPSGGASPAHWFMPTRKQWENMRDAKGGTYGAMATAYGISGHYWTSNEYFNGEDYSECAKYAWRFVTNSNIQGNMKSLNFNVRSIFAY